MYTLYWKMYVLNICTEKRNLVIHGKNGFATSKNSAKYRFENNFVKLSK